MANFTLITRILGTMLLLHCAGLVVAGQRYPVLPRRWRGRGRLPTRLHGLLWLVPAVYFLAAPLFPLYVQPPSIAVAVAAIRILSISCWSGLMVLSILHLYNPQPSKTELKQRPGVVTPPGVDPSGSGLR